MSEARSIRDLGLERFLAAATVAAYQVVQTPSGQAGFYDAAVAKGAAEFARVSDPTATNAAAATRV